ncbi:protein N-lysine methyltransferase FAM173A [Denticeps clupeoides]|uniref:Uncharacterized protein n=1 Tax=Denticeps clupeoides TaxID=299321 RepID=A0AAY4DKX3_9TELE|nr:protein N-lysine methyltransferase FAM173A-like [Denticeps clupeoides]
MEDSIDVTLQDKRSELQAQQQASTTLTASSGALLLGFYGLWTLFAQPGFRRVPVGLRVPYLPSSTAQTQNVMRLLRGRGGCLADLGSGDGRLVFAASSAGFRCTGFEINSVLRTLSRARACWKGVPASSVTFISDDFWKVSLTNYSNVTAFLAPGVMEVLGEKFLKELPDDARVIACRFPIPDWPCAASEGHGLDQAWAYDMRSVRSAR